MTDKAPDAYRTISEVAEDLDLPQHVLRFWETRFGQIKPLKRGGGRRYYRPDDVELLKGIRFLLYSEGYTIKGVQRILKEQGPKAVQALMRAEAAPAEEEEALPPQRTMPPQPQPVPRPIPQPEPMYQPVYEEPRWTPPAPPPVAPLPPMAARAPVASMPVPGYQEMDPPAPVQPELPELPPLTSPSAFRQAPRTSAPSYIEPDLFQQPVSAPAPVVPPPVAPPPPVTPPGPATVSFMRGGLSKPVVPENGLRAASPVSRPQVEPPARYVPLHDGEVEPSLPPLPAVRNEPAPRGPGLSADQRRALQAALFELSECRRMIERVRG